MRDVYESINFITFINEVLLKKLHPKKIQKVTQIPDNKILINMNGWLEISPRFVRRDITPYMFDVFITFAERSMFIFGRHNMQSFARILSC